MKKSIAVIIALVVCCLAGGLIGYRKGKQVRIEETEASVKLYGNVKYYKGLMFGTLNHKDQFLLRNKLEAYYEHSEESFGKLSPDAPYYEALKTYFRPEQEGAYISCLQARPLLGKRMN